MPTFKAQPELITFDQSLTQSINNWQFPLHPLRSIHRQAINEELLARLQALTKLPSNEDGQLQLTSAKLNDHSTVCGFRILPWDSNFFGFKIARIEFVIHPFHKILNQNSFDVVASTLAKTITALREQGCQHVSASVDPADIVTVNSLEECGFRIKDTINYHLFDLVKNPISSEAFTLGSIATIEDLPYLEDLTVRAFGSRQYIVNHFNNDLQFPQEKVAEMYKIWIQKSFTNERADAVMIVRKGTKPVGYLTAILPTEEQLKLGMNFADMGVGAVDPDYHGNGVFSTLHSSLLKWFQDRGIQHVLTRTAITTTGVNKACSKHRSVVALCPHTFHLNLDS